MFEDRLKLDLPSVSDIHLYVGLHCQRAPDFLGHMRQMTLVQEFRKKNRTPCRRKHCVHDDLSCGTMIRMVDSVGREQSLRIASYEDIGFEFANYSYNLTAHMQVGNKITVRSIHEMDSLHANDLRGCILLLMANGA